MDNSMGPLPEVDPRHDAFVAARRDLSGQVDRIRREHGLDLSEVFCVLGMEVSSWAGVAIDARRRADQVEEDEQDPPKRSRTL